MNNWPTAGIRATASLLIGLSVFHAQAQNVDSQPLFGEVSIAAGFEDPLVVEITPGGDSSVDYLGVECLGFINAEQPDYRLNYTPEANTLGIFVDSNQDTTLLVSDPRGNWHCNDDADFLFGTNPGIFFNTPVGGEYNVWVGVYELYAPAEPVSLVITEASVDAWAGMEIAKDDFDIFASLAANSSGIDFGDNQSDWANDGECDDPRFEGTGMAATTNAEDVLHDAADCWALFEAGNIDLIGGAGSAYFPVGVGRIVRGQLDSNDLSRSNGSLVDTVEFSGRSGDLLTLEMRSDNFKPVIILRLSDGEPLVETMQSSAKLHVLSGYELPENGDYEIWVSSENPGDSGAYTLTIEQASE